MPIAHDIITKNLITDTVCGLFNGGAVLMFKTDADVIVAQIALDAIAFAAAANGEAIANGFPKTTIVSIAGTVSKFEIRNSLDAPKIFGTVSLPGNNGDIELSVLEYAISDPITLASLNYRVLS